VSSPLKEFGNSLVLRVSNDSDYIGLIFAQWAIVNHGRLFLKITKSSPTFSDTFFRDNCYVFVFKDVIVLKAALRKQSPSMRKFAQSGYRRSISGSICKKLYVHAGEPLRFGKRVMRKFKKTDRANLF
jgi:hypothetical protein